MDDNKEKEYMVCLSIPEPLQEKLGISATGIHVRTTVNQDHRWNPSDRALMEMILKSAQLKAIEALGGVADDAGYLMEVGIFDTQKTLVAMEECEFPL